MGVPPEGEITRGREDGRVTAPVVELALVSPGLTEEVDCIIREMGSQLVEGVVVVVSVVGEGSVLIGVAAGSEEASVIIERETKVELCVIKEKALSELDGPLLD